MTTREVSEYLKLHEITICKYAAQGKIPAIRIGNVWRFNKDVIDRWITGVESDTENDEKPQRKGLRKKIGKKKSRKWKVHIYSKIMRRWQLKFCIGPHET